MASSTKRKWYKASQPLVDYEANGSADDRIKLGIAIPVTKSEIPSLR